VREMMTMMMMMMTVVVVMMLMMIMMMSTTTTTMMNTMTTNKVEGYDATYSAATTPLRTRVSHTRILVTRHQHVVSQVTNKQYQA